MSWVLALQEWNKDKKWSIPKKGSAQYNEVMELKNKMVDLGETKSKSKPQKSKKSSKKLYGFVEMTLITEKQMKDFNDLVNQKNSLKGGGVLEDMADALKKLAPFKSILQNPALQGSGLSLYGGSLKGKFKKLTNKDRKNINSMVKQNNMSFGEVFQKNDLNLIQNPADGLKKIFNLSQSLKEKADKAVLKNLPRLAKGDMTSLNRLLQSKSIGEFAAKELANKLDTLADEFKKKLPQLSENLVLGSGHCKKFSKKDINNINKAVEACECQTGKGFLDDIFGKLAEDPWGSLKKLLNFQQKNMAFKTLADSTQIGDKKPKKLYNLPWDDI
jgi:hypothetical protein